MLLSGAAANTGSAAVAAAALQYMAVAASLAGSGILAVNLDPDCRARSLAIP
jgi:hypothetical protein